MWIIFLPYEIRQLYLLNKYILSGLSRPRNYSVTGRPLPSARLVSTNIHNNASAPHVRYTLMIMQWGQFIDHDVIFTPVNKGKATFILILSYLIH